MADSANFALHRPELTDALRNGETKIRALLKDRVTLEAGATLIQADTDHRYVYRMREGWCGRLRTLEDGRSQYILVFLPGDLFAVKSMFVTKHPDAIQILSDSVVERIDYQALRHEFVRDPDIAARCTWQIVEEERRLHNWVVSLGRGNAEERVAHVLSEFRGRLILSGIITPSASAFPLPMTQEQFADHVGVSAVHINRVLKTLRDEGVLSFRNRVVTLHDPAALSRLALPLFDAYERASPAFNVASEK